MNSTQEDAVLNFDLDFLHPTPNNIPVPVLKQKYITQLKRRIIRVDALQNHRNAINQELNNKNKELEDTRMKLEATTLDYTRTSLEYKEALENASKWEKESEKLNILIQRLESERSKAVNQLHAIQSHVVQLEQLVKLQERKIETLEQIDKKNIDKLVAEKLGAKTKQNEKEILVWKRKYETLYKQLQDKKCGDKKSNNYSLRKIDKQGNKITSGSIFSDEHSDNENYTSINIAPPARVDASQNNVNMVSQCSITSKENTRMESDSDCGHDVFSVDTGCGSSLSSSDNEKWLNSPDYVFSPIQTESIEHNRARKYVNTATSPISSVKMVVVSTSPIFSVQTVDIATSPKPSIKVVDAAISPVTIQMDLHNNPKPEHVVKKLEEKCHHNITSNTESVTALKEKIPRVVIEKLREDCYENKMSKSCILVNEKCSTKVEGIEKLTTIEIDIEEVDYSDDDMADTLTFADTVNSTKFRGFEQIQIGESEDKACSDNKIYEPLIFEEPIVSTAVKSFENIPQIEVTEEKECSYNMVDDSCIFEDALTHAADKDIEKRSSINTEITPERDTVNKKIYESSIFDDCTSSIVVKSLPHTKADKIQEKNCQDEHISTNKKASNMVKLYGEISPIEAGNNKAASMVKLFGEISPIKVENKLDMECSNSKMNEDSSLAHNETDRDFIGFENKCNVETQIIQEKTCLELNNSNNIIVDSSVDNEIEMILNTMRVHHKLITPIPKSPRSMCCSSGQTHGHGTQTTEPIAHSVCQDAAIAREHADTAKQEAASASQDAAKIREDNRKLMTTLNNLMKEMCNIKSFLKNKLAMPDALLEQNNNSLPQDTLFDVSADESSDKKSTNHLDNEPLANTKKDAFETVATRPRDIKITVISDEIIKPADIDNNSNGNRLLPKSVHHDEMELEHSVQQNVYPENMNDKPHIEIKPPTKEDKNEKNREEGKGRKLTSLDKYRKKCEFRKYKIKKETPPLVKPQMKPKPVSFSKKITECDSARTLNDTDVYAKAVKIMTELNSKKRANIPTQALSKIISQKNTNELQQNNTECNKNTSCSPTVDSLERSNVNVSESRPEPVATFVKPEMTCQRGSGKLPEIRTTHPRGSIKSPEIVLPKPTIASPRCSLKSPKATLTAPPIASMQMSINSLEPIAPVKDIIYSTRQTMRSPELVVPSSKHKIASQQHSAEFSADILNSLMVAKTSSKSVKTPESSTAPEKHTISTSRHTVRSPELLPAKPRITSPSCSLKSPEITVISSSPPIASPSISMNSPEPTLPRRHIIYSLRHTIRSPELRTPSLNNKITSPRFTSPRKSITSPDLITAKNMIASSRYAMKSPELAIPFLKCKITSPPHSANNSADTVTSSTLAMTSPRKSMKSPESVSAPAKHMMSSPSHPISSPGVRTPSLNNNITTPRRSTEYLEDIVTTPKHVTTSPRKSMTSPELVTIPANASPTRRIKSPELGDSYVKDRIASPRHSAKYTESIFNYPTPATTSPSPAIISPTFTIASTSMSIRSPESAFPVKQNINSTRYSIKSPELTVASPIPVIKLQRSNIISPKYIPSSLKAAVMPCKPNHTASRPLITSPEAGITYSELGTQSSGASSSLPESAVTSTRLSLRSPKRAITSPYLPMTSEVPNISSPRSAVISPITTRSRSKNDKPIESFVTAQKDSQDLHNAYMATYSKENQDKNELLVGEVTRKRTRSSCSESSPSKRMLRSTKQINTDECTIQACGVNDKELSVGDLSPSHPRESILCVMIEKYAVKTVKQFSRNVPDIVLKTIYEKIEKYVTEIKGTTSCNKQKLMNNLVEELRKYDYKDFVSGLVHYLFNPERKVEFFTRTSIPPVPQMTKSEEMLLYVIRNLKSRWCLVDVIEPLLSAIEHNLFKLNRTPELGVIESVSHFYALLCRYFNQKSRLIAFMLDAMYCLLFKSVPLVRQCLDVWPHVIPLAHMSIAKTPLVTCFVYLLHFFKCEDRYNRVQDIRNLLNRKYFYQITEWNEGKILELFNNAIKELKDIPNEKKMLRIALIILGKRHGPRWTQNHIINKMLQPFIENKDTPVKVKEFCISIIGPLMKPYPIEMKVHCEIAINQLADILKTTRSKQIEEAVITSLVIMSRHNNNRVTELLLSRKMRAMSPEVEKLIRGYIRSKPLNAWIKNLSRTAASGQSQLL